MMADRDSRSIPEPPEPILPVEWYGWELSWDGGYRPDSIPVGSVRFNVAALGCDSEEVTAYLFVSRVELSRARCSDPSLPDGFFLSFVVLEARAGSPVVRHDLVQSESVAYSSTREKSDYIVATELDQSRRRSLGRKPEWKAEEGYWPTLAGEPMLFLDQWTLAGKEAPPADLGGEDIFLFCSRATEPRLIFKITTQDRGSQTAEDHYLEEEVDDG